MPAEPVPPEEVAPPDARHLPAPPGTVERLRQRLRDVRDRAPGWLRRPLVWQSIGLLAITLAILGPALATFGSYLSFGNFELPYTTSQYRQLLDPPWVWTRFQYYGLPTPAPFVSLVYYVTSLAPLSLAALAVGPVAAAKLYMVVSTFLLGFSFLLFARSLIRRPRAQFLAAVFLLAGPFQMVLYGQGDFQQFVSESFVFLSIFVLWRAIEEPERRWLWFPLSLWLLLLSVWSLQLFALGTVLYVTFAVAFVYRASRGHRFWARLGRIVPRLAMLPVLLLPLLVTVFFGALDLGNSSPQALSVSTFSLYSAEPWRIFFLQAYFNLAYNLVAQSGAWVAIVWSSVLIALLTLVWVGGLIARDRRLLLLFLIVLAASFLGAGSLGPLGAVNVYLYIHVPGFQALNASYYWDWMLVFPSYALAIGAVYEDFAHRATVSHVTPVPGRAGVWLGRIRRRLARPQLQRMYRVGAATVVVLVVVVAVVPYGLGAPYRGPQGMHAADYPADYGGVPQLLENLVGSSYAGVALFNPDLNWFLDNSTFSVDNAFFLYPSVRTVGISVYGAYPTQSNVFAYWVYQQFYQNTTRYAGELFATIGVEYLVVFYGTQAASGYPGTFLNFTYGKNASVLMQYQVGVVPAVESKDFAIYRNLYFGGDSAAVENLSLVAGDYGTLDAVAYTGVNLTNQALVYTTDLTPTSCQEELGRVARVYAGSLNALLSLGLQCNYLSATNPLTYVESALSPGSGWTISTRVQGAPSVVDAWPQPLAIADGVGHSLSIPLSAHGCGTGCSLWLPVRFASDGGSVTFTWAGQTELFRTNRGYDGYNNSMIWVQLPFSITASGDLGVTTGGGWNAIGNVLVVGAGFATTGGVLAWLSSALAGREVIQATSGVSLDRVGPGIYTQKGAEGSFYGASTTGFDPGGSSLLLEDDTPEPLAVPVSLASAAGSGWLSFLVRDVGETTVQVSVGSQQEEFGFATGATAPGERWSWVRMWVNETPGNIGAAWQLTLESGSLYLAEWTFVPAALAPAMTAIVPGPVLAIASVTSSGLLSDLKVNSTTSPGSTWVTGSANLGAASYESIYATVRFTGTLPVGSSLEFRLNASAGLVLSVNGLLFGGAAAGEVDLYAAPLGTTGDAGFGANVTLELLAFGALPAGGSARFSFGVTVTDAPAIISVSDLDPSVQTTLSSDSTGYQLAASAGAPLFLARVADYNGLTSPTEGVSLSPSLGSLTTLLWNPMGATNIRVTTADSNDLLFAIELAAVATLGWVAVELAVLVSARRRTPAEGDSPPSDTPPGPTPSRPPTAPPPEGVPPTAGDTTRGR